MRRGFTLVELMVVVAIIGILAALAVPSFLRAVRKARAAEAEGVMRKMADGAKTYFTAEQIIYGNLTGAAEPWHWPGIHGGGRGYPVQYKSRAFPGGGGFWIRSSADVPEGGSKVAPDPQTSRVNYLTPVMNKLGISFSDPAYFRYEYRTGSGRGPNATVTLKAEADMAAGPKIHTVTQSLAVQPGSFEVLVRPTTVRDEFE